MDPAEPQKRQRTDSFPLYERPTGQSSSSSTDSDGWDSDFTDSSSESVESGPYQHPLQSTSDRGLTTDPRTVEGILEDSSIEKSEKAIVLCTCVIINGRMSASFVEDKHFRQLWTHLAGPYTAAVLPVPSREQVLGRGLQWLAGLYDRQTRERLDHKRLTIKFDGWRTRDGTLVHAVAAVTRQGDAFLLHAADQSALVSTLCSSVAEVEPEHVQCVVSGETSSGVDARIAVCAAHPHIQSFSSFADAIRLILKDAYSLCGFERVAATVQDVQFFFEQSSRYEAALASFYRAHGSRSSGKLAPVCDEGSAAVFTGSKSMLVNRQGLEHLAEKGMFKVDHGVETTLQDDEFWREFDCASKASLRPAGKIANRLL